MGTSMQLSEKQKQRLHFRNHAMPRKNIPPHMQKYYRYKVEYLVNRLNQNQDDHQALQQIKRITKTIKLKQMQHFNQMPNDIPSIEQHSQILNSYHEHQEIHEQQNQASEVQEYKLQATKPQNNSQHNQQLFQNENMDVKHEYPCQQHEIKNQKKSSDNSIKNKKQSKSSISQLPNNSQPSNQKRNSQKKSSSGGKKSSNGKIQSESNHILSDIILKREAYYTINYQMITDDIKQEIYESMKRDGWHTCCNYQDYKAKFSDQNEPNYEKQNQENQDNFYENPLQKIEKIKNQHNDQAKNYQNKVEVFESKIQEQVKQKSANTNQLKNSYEIPNNFSGIETIPARKAKLLSMTLQLNSNIKNNGKIMNQQINPSPSQANPPFTNKTNLPTQMISNISNAYAYNNGSFQGRTDIIYENSHTGLYSNNSSNLNSRPRKLLYF